MQSDERMRYPLTSPRCAVFLLLTLLISTNPLRCHCATSGFNVALTNPSLAFATVASLEGGGVSSDFSSVDYRARASTANVIDYCTETSCGACSQLPTHDPCQVMTNA